MQGAGGLIIYNITRNSTPPSQFLLFSEVFPIPRPHVQPGAAGEEADQGAARAAATPAAVRPAAGLRDSSGHSLRVSQIKSSHILVKLQPENNIFHQIKSHFGEISALKSDMPPNQITILVKFQPKI